MGVYIYHFLRKNIVFPIFIMFSLSPALNAANHIIEFGGTVGFNYSPAELTVAVGDTVTWQGVFGSHPLSSTSVPPGAAGFSNNSGSSYSYVVGVPGTYNYRCDLHFSAGMTGSFSATVTSLENDRSAVLPDVFQLHQNYPNPFNPATTIGYQLPAAGMVELTVYNLLGEKIATLVSDRQAAGPHRITWNAGRNPSGVYYYQLKAGNFQAVKRMFLLR